MEESRLSKQKEELRSSWSGELDCRLFPAEPHPSSTFRRYIHERICSNCSGKNTARSIIRCGRTAGREAAVPSPAEGKDAQEISLLRLQKVSGRTRPSALRSHPLSRATVSPGVGGCLKSSSASRKQTPDGSMTRRGESWKARRISSPSCKRIRPLPLTSSSRRRAWLTTWSTAPASIRFT